MDRRRSNEQFFLQYVGYRLRQNLVGLKYKLIDCSCDGIGPSVANQRLQHHYKIRQMRGMLIDPFSLISCTSREVKLGLHKASVCQPVKSSGLWSTIHSRSSLLIYAPCHLDPSLTYTSLPQMGISMSTGEAGCLVVEIPSMLVSGFTSLKCAYMIFFAFGTVATSVWYIQARIDFVSRSWTA